MSYVILCKGKRAKQPYVTEDTRFRIYTAEELCYYLYSNVSLCDRDLVRPELAAFLERECGLPDLAESIRIILKKDARPERVAAQIFAYTDYLTKQEREAVCERIRKYSTLGLNERRKMRADYLYLAGDYRGAVCDYEEMLEKEAYDSPDMRHNLLYNIGCCYGAMFYYDIAYGWFLQAAATDIAKDKDLAAALFCKRMSLEDSEWEDYLKERPDFAAFAAPMERQREELIGQWEKTPEARKLLSYRNSQADGCRQQEAFLNECLEEWKKRV